MKYFLAFLALVVVAVNAEQVPESEEDVGCFLCKTIVATAKQFADKEEPEVEKELDKVCDQLGSMAGICKEAVQEIVPLIYQYLDSDLNPEEICQKIKLCPATVAAVKLMAKPTQLDTECDICKTIVDAAKKFADKEEPEVEKLLDEVCDKLGEFAEQCKAAVKEILPIVYKYLDDELSAGQLCAQIGMCPAKKEQALPVLVKAPFQQLSTGCDICKQIAAAAKQFADKEEPEIEQYLNQACDKLGQFADECKAAVKEILPVIYQYLDSELGPDGICAQIGLCASKMNARIVPKPQQLSVGCDLCKQITAAAKQFADKEEPEVEKYLNKMCDQLGQFAADCKEAVKELLPQIYKFLDSELGPDGICAELGLCPKTVDFVKIVPKPVQLNFVECDLCKVIVEAAKKYADKEEPEVEKLLDDLCDQLGEFAADCKEAVKEIVPLAYKYLDSELSPGAICVQIGLCQTLKLRAAFAKLHAKQQQLSAGCDICKQIAAAAKQFADKEEPEVEQYLNQACDQLGEFAAECKEAVKEILPLIYKYLDSELGPDGICAQIGLCPSSKTPVLVKKPKHPRFNPERFDVSCDICTALIEVGKQYADQEEPVVKQKLDEECTKLGFLSDFCKDLVNKYIDEIYNYLNTGLSDKEICQKLGLC